MSNEQQVAELIDQVAKLTARVSDLEEQVKDMPDTISREIGQRAARAIQDIRTD